MGGARGQIATLITALKGNALHVCAGYLSTLMLSAMPSLAQAVAYLDRIYNDPQQQSKAIDELSRLRQGTDTFDMFFTEFERLLALAGGDNWPEAVKIQSFRAATSTEIIRSNIASDDAKTLEDLVNQYRKIATNLALIDAPRTIFTTHAPVPRLNETLTSSDGTVPMEIDSYNSSTPVHGRKGLRRFNKNKDSRNYNGQQGPGLPTDTQLRGKRSIFVSKEELQRRRDTNACLRCGRLGCQVSVCPLAAPRPSTTRARTTTTYVEPDLSIYNHSEQGNE